VLNKKKKRKWNHVELEILENNWETKTDKEIQELFDNNIECNERTENAISQKRRIKGWLRYKETDKNIRTPDAMNDLIKHQKKGGFIE
jgi:hypothetical protein